MQHGCLICSGTLIDAWAAASSGMGAAGHDDDDGAEVGEPEEEEEEEGEEEEEEEEMSQSVRDLSPTSRQVWQDRMQTIELPEAIQKNETALSNFIQLQQSNVLIPGPLNPNT